MGDLPNGFTGFAHLPDGFESAGEASRRSRGVGAASDRPYGTADSSAASRAHREASGSARGGDSLAGIGAFTGGAGRASHGTSARDGDAIADVGAFSRGAGKAVRPSEPPADFAGGGEGRALDAGALDVIPATDRRWAWVEVDTAAIRHNVLQVRRLLQPGCRLMAVVKADAYGHGAVEVAKVALGAGADRLAVATVDEAVQLRKAGIAAPILLLSQPPETSIPLLVGYRITPAVYDPAFAVTYGEEADRRGERAPYHLAVNTGMNRIGVHYADALEFLYQVNFHRALDLEGAFTHFATAESSETLDFQRQARRFAETVNGMRAAGFNPGLVHAANSAAALRFPEVHFDMVRSGCALYGLHPCRETQGRVDLRPAMSVHARIVDVRMPPMSEGVSAGFNYRSPGSVKVCTIPLGYADGLPWGLSGNADFIMGGRYVRQVGDICMDLCMFEVDMRSYGTRERLDPQVGDEVVIVGSQGAAEVTLGDLAQKLHASPVELALGFGRRLARVCR